MIQSIAVHYPSQTLTNDELAVLYPDWPADKIFEKTGIRERRVVSAGECASDLAAAAGDLLFGQEERNADWMLFCTQSPDYLLPASSCVLQERLKLPTRCAALDFNQGCSGYLYGLSLASALIESKQAERVLLLTADTYSRLIHPEDKSTRTIFGDAGTATLLTAQAPGRLHSFVLGTDGRGAKELIVAARGARGATDAMVATHNLQPECLFMNGPEVFNFTLKAVPQLVGEVLGRAKLTLAEIDLVVFHQANGFMLEHLRRKIGIPPEKFVQHFSHCGNTVSSTIPIALEHVLATGRLRRGMKVLLAGFGVGFSWGGCILEW